MLLAGFGGAQNFVLRDIPKPTVHARALLLGRRVVDECCDARQAVVTFRPCISRRTAALQQKLIYRILN
jgi:hypothetical protein